MDMHKAEWICLPTVSDQPPVLGEVMTALRSAHSIYVLFFVCAFMLLFNAYRSTPLKWFRSMFSVQEVFERNQFSFFVALNEDGGRKQRPLTHKKEPSVMYEG